MKKIFSLLICILCLCLFLTQTKMIVYSQSLPEISYVVYDENGDFLFERISVVVGDIYIDKNFNKYEVYYVDEVTSTAKCRFVEKLKKPNLTRRGVSNINETASKVIALYMSHNDESYIIGDGTQSIYGKGGIHDISKLLAFELKQKNINVFLDESLHIPHDSYAYSRSRITANNLLKNNVNAIFDIHRDGASRSTYAKTFESKERCMVRIVVGQANANKEKNLQFALYLMSVADSVCPWLFLDIFYAHGHYNQDLFEKALLFEMGSHTMEKSLVEETVPYLAEVINTTLFNTSIDTQTGDLIIGSSNPNNPTIDEALVADNSNVSYVIALILSTVGILVGLGVFLYIKQKRNSV